jgi:hypothetical protein
MAPKWCQFTMEDMFSYARNMACAPDGSDWRRRTESPSVLWDIPTYRTNKFVWHTECCVTKHILRTSRENSALYFVHPPRRTAMQKGVRNVRSKSSSLRRSANVSSAGSIREQQHRFQQRRRYSGRYHSRFVTYGFDAGQRQRIEWRRLDHRKLGNAHVFNGRAL